MNPHEASKTSPFAKLLVPPVLFFGSRSMQSNLPSIQSLDCYAGYTTGSRPHVLDELDVSSKAFFPHVMASTQHLFSSLVQGPAIQTMESNKCHVESFSSRRLPGFTIGGIAPICSIHAVRTLSYQHNRLVSCLKKTQQGTNASHFLER